MRTAESGVLVDAAALNPRQYLSRLGLFGAYLNEFIGQAVECLDELRYQELRLKIITQMENRRC
jgi:hypothetical protein